MTTGGTCSASTTSSSTTRAPTTSTLRRAAHDHAHRRLAGAYLGRRHARASPACGQCRGEGVGESITPFTEELPWLKGADLEWVMGRGICEWLGWPLPVE
jgi:hypothetical protein